MSQCLGIVCLEDAEAIDITPCIEDDEVCEGNLRPSLKSAVRRRPEIFARFPSAHRREGTAQGAGVGWYVGNVEFMSDG